MTPNQVFSQVRDLIDLLLDNEIAITANSVVCERSGPRSRITWQSSIGSWMPLTQSEFATIEEYRNYILNQSYSVVLFDGSLMQVTYDFHRNDIEGHRLCYYPCPFEVDPGDLQILPILDVVDYYREETDKYLRLRSPIRFDYAPRNADRGHPASHVHFLRPSCRCAVVGAISLGHFCRFIFSHFYPDLWRGYSFIRSFPLSYETRTIIPDEEYNLHFAYRRYIDI